MAKIEVHMEIPAVTAMAKDFNEYSAVLADVSNELVNLANMLKNTGFIGHIGARALLQTIEELKPQVDRMSDKCEEINGDLNSSVKAYEQGDEEGAARFH